MSPTEAAIQSTVDLHTLQKAAIQLDAFPEEIAHYSRSELMKAAKAFDQSVNRGSGFPDAPFSTGVGQAQFQRAIAEGGGVIAGIDLSAIDKSMLSGRAKDKLRAAGIDVDDESVDIDVQDLIDVRVTGGELKRSFAQTLTSLGLLDTKTGKNSFGAGNFFNQSNVDLVREGLFPEQRQIRETLADRAASLAGSLDPDTFTNDAFVRAALGENQQGVRGAFAARGLNNSGAAAFEESGRGLMLLEELRRQREQEILGLTDVGGNLAIGGPAGMMAGGLMSDVFQQNLGLQQMQNMVAQTHEATAELRRQGQFNAILEQQGAASLGSFLGGSGLSGGVANVTGAIAGGIQSLGGAGGTGGGHVGTIGGGNPSVSGYSLSQQGPYSAGYNNSSGYSDPQGRSGLGTVLAFI